MFSSNMGVSTQAYLAVVGEAAKKLEEASKDRNIKEAAMNKGKADLASKEDKHLTLLHCHTVLSKIANREVNEPFCQHLSKQHGTAVLLGKLRELVAIGSPEQLLIDQVNCNAGVKTTEIRRCFNLFDNFGHCKIEKFAIRNDTKEAMSNSLLQVLGLKAMVKKDPATNRLVLMDTSDAII